MILCHTFAILQNSKSFLEPRLLLRQKLSETTLQRFQLDVLFTRIFLFVQTNKTQSKPWFYLKQMSVDLPCFNVRKPKPISCCPSYAWSEQRAIHSGTCCGDHSACWTTKGTANISFKDWKLIFSKHRWEPWSMNSVKTLVWLYIPLLSLTMSHLWWYVCMWLFVWMHGYLGWRLTPLKGNAQRSQDVGLFLRNLWSFWILPSTP